MLELVESDTTLPIIHFASSRLSYPLLRLMKFNNLLHDSRRNSAAFMTSRNLPVLLNKFFMPTFGANFIAIRCFKAMFTWCSK